MKKIELGGREITLVGSPMTPFFYKRAFNQSLSGDLMKMQDLSEDKSLFDDINILQMIWAMEKTAKMGKLIDFESWLAEFEYLDLTDVLDDTVDEAMRATFCEAKDHQESKTSN